MTQGRQMTQEAVFATKRIGLPYRLGLPAWAFTGWRGTYFLDKPSMLSSYATVYNAVEGNTTFYHIPDPATVARWHEAVHDRDFIFHFKLPRSVTHEQTPDLRQLDVFLKRIGPLGKHVGPLLLQFPERVGIAQLRRLKPVLDAVAEEHQAVIEVRNGALFREPEVLEPLLEYYGFGRVILDSRPLYQGNINHPDVLAAVHEKPDVPVLQTVYNKLALVRLILHPDNLSNASWVDQWARQTAKWLDEGLTPSIMIHCPNNVYCPLFSEQFHHALLKHASIEIPPLSAWPVPQQGQLI